MLLGGAAPARAQRDSVGEARRTIEYALAPLDASRRDIRRRLAAERGTPGADSSFWAWYGGYRVLVDSLTRNLQAEFIIVQVDPLGAAGQQLLRRRRRPIPERESARQRAVMDTLRALIEAHGAHADDAEGEVDYAPGETTIRSEMAPFLGDLSRRVLELLVLEQAKPVGADAAVAISWDDLGDRLARADDLLSRRPLATADTLVRDFYHSYLSAYLGAWDNTPGFDQRPPHELLPALRASYAKYVRTHRDTRSGETIRAYVELLEAHGWKRDASVDEFVRGVEAR